MNKLGRYVSLSLISTAFLFCAATAWSQNSAIPQKTQAFLDAYAKGDKEAVLRFVDQKNLTMYGSDVAETVHGSDALLKMMDDDQKLWGGTGRIGKIENVSLVESPTLVSIFFDASFTVGSRPPVSVRFAAVWKLEGEQWLLVQSSNVVPTVHQSAAELLQPAAH